MESGSDSGGGNRKTEVKDRVGRSLENYMVTVFTWIPRVLLIVFLISFLLFLCFRLSSPELVPHVTIENVLYLVRKILEFLYSRMDVTAIHVVALTVVCILIATVFSWRWVLGYITTIFLVPVGLAYLSSFFAVFFSQSLKPVTGYTIGDLLAFGFMKMVELNYLFYKFLEEWVGQQLYTFTALMISMSSIGVLAMYLDKKAAEASGRRIAERDLVRYALLGGGIGIILGAFMYRHKTRHLWFLSQIIIITFCTLYVFTGSILSW